MVIFLIQVRGMFKHPMDNFEFKVDFRYDKSLRGNSGIQLEVSMILKIINARPSN